MNARCRCVLWGLVFLLGVALVWKDPAVAVRSFSLEVAPGQVITGRMYQPRAAVDPVPALLFCHGISSSRENFVPLAQEAARRGMAGVVFDFGGHGRSYPRPLDQDANLADAAAVVAWMRQQTTLDPQRLGFVGHSMGGTTALELAKVTPQARATVVLGIAGFATPTSPANVLFGSGIFEEFNSASTMQALFSTAVAQPTPPFITTGDFAQGTARQLVFSPTSEHGLATYDPFLQRATLHWVEQAFGLPTSLLPLQTTQRLWGWVLSAGAAWGLGLAIYRKGLDQAPRSLRLAAGVGLIAVLGLPGWGSGIALGGLGILAIAHFQRRSPQLATIAAQRMVFYGVLAYLLCLLALVGNAVVTGSLGVMPRAMAGLPALVQSLVIALAYDRFHVLRFALESRIGWGLFGVLLALELWQPGLVLYRLNALVIRLVSCVRQPWHWGQPSGKTLALVPLLLAILLALLVGQLQAGVLTWESGQFALRLVGLFGLLPGLGAVGVLRSPYLQRCEARWWGTAATAQPNPISRSELKHGR